MKNIVWAITVLLLGILTCGRATPPAAPSETMTSPKAYIDFDCTSGNPDCTLLEILGDTPNTYPNGSSSFFHGFADPTVRQDPQTGRLWMAYSWPRVHILPDGNFVPGVDIHLAYSDDGGNTWVYHDELWTSHEDTDRGGDGAPGFTDHEVANLLPRQTENSVIWYGVRLDYFIPLEGKYTARPPGSFRIKIMQAASPPDLATAAASTLGSTLTAPGWDVDIDLSALSTETEKCGMWNEPALYFEEDELFLVLRCLAFDSFQRPAPEESDIFVFATSPNDDVRTWQWRYVGALAGHEEARELGGRGLTQADIVLAQDGTLLAILTPNDWDTSLKEFIHYGCRVVEIESMDPPALKRDDNGKLVVRTVINASDQQPLGPGSCSYDPASATGILIARREKTSTAMTSQILQTGMMP